MRSEQGVGSPEPARPSAGPGYLVGPLVALATVSLGALVCSNLLLSGILLVGLVVALGISKSLKQ